MHLDHSLGVTAHRGGLLVERPELSVGIVQAVSRTSGLSLEVIARQPLDRRDATQRQQDIRSRREEPVRIAPRRLLPLAEEGQDLRLGWLDATGRAHWEYSTSSMSSSGDHYAGTEGPSWRCSYALPPMFDELTLVLAWPEIGFEETTVTIPLPDRAAVEQATTSIWQAPVTARPVTEPLIDHDADWHSPVPIEAGTVIAGPQVLHRGEHVVVVLTRLTVIGQALSVQLHGIAAGPLVDAVTPGSFSRRRREGVFLAVAEGDDAFWIGAHQGASYGGDDRFETFPEFVIRRPDGDALDLVVAWPAAGLAGARVRIPLGEGGS